MSGNTQIGVAGRELDDPLVVRVVDSSGGPVQGQVVNFRVVLGGGSVFAGTAITDADGVAKERWTLGASTGPQKVEARAVDSRTGAAITFATFDATAVLDGSATPSVTILGRAAPSDPTTCQFAAGGQFLLGAGVLDVGASAQPTYSMVVYVQNGIASSVGNSISPATWRADAAAVRVNPPGSAALAGSRPLLELSAEAVLPVNSVTVAPGATATQFLQAIPAVLGAQLAGLVEPGSTQRIVLGISLQGQTLAGVSSATSEWYFPLDLCKGCLVGPTCLAGQVPIATNCFGIGQDSPPVCGSP